MALKSKGKNLKHNTKHPTWKDHGSALVLSVVKDAVNFAPVPELQRAALAALFVMQTIQEVNINKEAYERLGDDSVSLIAAIWCWYKKAKVPNEWPSEAMQEILEDLKQYNSTIMKFELIRKNDQLSDQILHRNEEEDIKCSQEITTCEYMDQEEAERIHREKLKTVKEFSVVERLDPAEADRAERRHTDDRWYTDELRKIEKEAIYRHLELELLRTAASVVDLAHRLKKAQEEISQLKQKIVADQDGRRSTLVQSSKRRVTGHKTGGGGWRGNVVVEGEEEEEAGRPVRRSSSRSRAKRNPSKSPKRWLVLSSDSTDDVEDFQTLRSSKIRTVGRKLSRTSTEDESEAKDCQLEMERLRRAASAVDLVKHLKKAQREREARSSKKQSSRLQDEEEERRGNIVINEASLEEAEEDRPPVRRSSKAKRNPSKSMEDEHTSKKAKRERLEVAALKQNIAANQDSRRSDLVQARSSKKQSSRLQDEEEEWRGNIIVDETNSEEAQEDWRNLSKSREPKHTSKKAQREREVGVLKRNIADSRRSAPVQVRSNKKETSRLQDEEEEWRGKQARKKQRKSNLP
ncbi:hypothetical protein BYT27DRAFT_7294516 [Phlegmacium glaucopus]|nr:hypothetical protein BYT27DRAFT_7294516 [Phlegmacium glaucopus]